MPIDIEQFWGANFYKHPPITDDIIRYAEEQLCVKLPKEYIELLRIQNGGFTQRFVYPTKHANSWADDHFPLDELAGIVTDPNHRTAQNLLKTAYMTEEWGLPPRQVLLCGDGHWWLTLDYRNGEEPTVAWLDVEIGEDLQVAPSFQAFLEGLRPATTET